MRRVCGVLVVLGGLLSVPDFAAAQTWAHRAATTVDAPVLVTIHNNAVAADLLFPTQANWTQESEALAYLVTFDATRVVVRNGVVVGFWGSIDWRTGGREAIVAPVDVPYISTSLNASNRTTAARWLARAVVNQLLAATSAGGVTPTFLTMYWPLKNTGGSVMTSLGCQVLSQPTEDGVPVLQQMRCDLAAMSAALTAVGF